MELNASAAGYTDSGPSPYDILSIFEDKLSKLKSPQQLLPADGRKVYSKNRFKEIRACMINAGELSEKSCSNSYLDLLRINDRSNSSSDNTLGNYSSEPNPHQLRFYPRLTSEARKSFLEIVELSIPGEQSANTGVISGSSYSSLSSDISVAGSRILIGHKYQLFPEVALIDPSLIKSYSLSIGRSLQSQICIPDILVSKNHAIISFYEGYGFYIKDVGSKHGTFIDDVELSKGSTFISTNDVCNTSSSNENRTKNSTKIVINKKPDSSEPLEDGEILVEDGKKSSPSVSNKTVDYCYLYDGAVLTLGRVKLRFSIERQSAMLAKGFEANNSTAASAYSNSLKSNESEVKRHQVIISGAYSRELLSIERSHRDDMLQKLGGKRKVQDTDLNSHMSHMSHSSVINESHNIAIKPSDIGHQMILKHGWVEGSRALGKQEQGVSEPISIVASVHSAGLGYGATAIYNAGPSNSNNNDSNSIDRDKNNYPKGSFTFGDFIYNP